MIIKKTKVAFLLSQKEKNLILSSSCGLFIFFSKPSKYMKTKLNVKEIEEV